MSIASGMPSSHLIHPLMSSSLSALNLSQHQGLFQWVGCPHQMTKILEHQLQHQSFQWIFRANFHSDGLVGSPCSPRDSGVFSTPQLKSIHSSALLLPYGPALTTVHDPWEDYSLDYMDLCWRVMSLFFNMLSRFVKSSPLPPVVDHIFSELCTTTSPSWVALQDMAYSFIELHSPFTSTRLWSMKWL